MKKLLFGFLLMSSMSAIAQDSTKVKGMQLPAKLIYFLLPAIMQPSNDSLFQVAIDLRPKLRVSIPPTGATLVTVDSIPTVELANLYNYSLNAPAYTKMAVLMQTQLSTIRSMNSYLDTLCLSFENFYDSKLKDQISLNKKMATGKIQ